MTRPEVHLIAGTRPEAIKLAPLIARIRDVGRLRPVVVASGQHPAMVSQALEAFGLAPDVSLRVERVDGGQPELAGNLVRALDAHLAGHRPAAVVVHGDTTTTLAGGLAGFWRRVPVIHLEAGLRSGDLDGPFPEEANRRLVAQITRLHLAPTPRAAGNLLAEGARPEQVLVTGNTVVDAALAVAAARQPIRDPRLAPLVPVAERGRRRLVLVTAHRRESWGEPLDQVLRAVRTLLSRRPDVDVVLPCHPNPAVRAQVESGLRGVAGAYVTGPMSYPELTRVLAASYLVLTDSGGIQEEAPTFRVPALVLREVTERVESIEAGCAALVGLNEDRIVAAASELLDDPKRREAMTARSSPYGDGRASERCEQAIAALLGLAERPADLRIDGWPPVTAAGADDVPDAA